MPGVFSQRRSSFIVFIVAIVLLVIAGKMLFFSSETSVSEKQMTAVLSRLKKLEAQTAGLKNNTGDFAGGENVCKAYEKALSEIKEREAELLARLIDLEKKLALLSRSHKPIGEAAPNPREHLNTGRPSDDKDGSTAAPAAKDSDSGGENKYYEVQKGDTVYSISRKYGLTPEDLRKQNKLDSNIIKPGQKLQVIP